MARRHENASRGAFASQIPSKNVAIRTRFSIIGWVGAAEGEQHNHGHVSHLPQVADTWGKEGQTGWWWQGWVLTLRLKEVVVACNNDSVDVGQSRQGSSGMTRRAQTLLVMSLRQKESNTTARRIWTLLAALPFQKNGNGITRAQTLLAVSKVEQHNKEALLVASHVLPVFSVNRIQIRKFAGVPFAPALTSLCSPHSLESLPNPSPWTSVWSWSWSLGCRCCWSEGVWEVACLLMTRCSNMICKHIQMYISI